MCSVKLFAILISTSLIRVGLLDFKILHAINTIGISIVIIKMVTKMHIKLLTSLLHLASSVNK